jgi:hypothetical protein
VEVEEKGDRGSLSLPFDQASLSLRTAIARHYKREAVKADLSWSFNPYGDPRCGKRQRIEAIDTLDELFSRPAGPGGSFAGLTSRSAGPGESFAGFTSRPAGPGKTLAGFTSRLAGNFKSSAGPGGRLAGIKMPPAGPGEALAGRPPF